MRKTLEDAREVALTQFNSVNTRRGQMQTQLQQMTEEMLRLQGEVRQLDALLKQFQEPGGG